MPFKSQEARVAYNRRWRRLNPEHMAFLSRRDKLWRQLVVEWVRANRPDVAEACRKQAWQMVPVVDLDIAKESLAASGRLVGKRRY